MNLDKKYPVELTSDSAKALKAHLMRVVSFMPDTDYDRLFFVTLGRIIEKIHKKDLTDQAMKFKLNAEQNLALQILFSRYRWPDDPFGQHSVQLLRQQLEPVIFAHRSPLSGACGADGLAG